MTSRERLLTALKGGRPDRVPIQIYGTMGYRDEIIDLTPNHKKLAQAALEKCDLNFSWGEYYHEFLLRFLSTATKIEVERVPEDGGEVVTKTISTPKGDLRQVTYEDKENLSHTRYRETFVKTPEDLDKIGSIPYVPFEPEYESYFFKEKEVGDRGVVIHDFPDALAVLASLFNPEEFALFCIMHEEKVLEFLRMMTDRTKVYLRFLLERDIKPIYLFGGPEYAAPPLMGPDHFKKFVALFDTELIELIHSHDAMVIMHCHGSVKKVLPMIREMRPDGLHPVEGPPMGDVTLKEARELLGPEICMIGNIQIGDLYSDSGEEIDAKVKVAIEEGAPGGAFILGITASQYSIDFSEKLLQNYMQYIDSGRKYGMYKEVSTI
jgi:Uroporphyrinogen decarboxylase (URO-D)